MANKPKMVSIRALTRRRAVGCLLASASGLLIADRSHAAERQIKVGSSLALSGPSQALGLGMRAGLKACFETFNAMGGHHGAKLSLVALDDGYQPSTARENMLRLIDQEKVLAVLGNVGTPTAELTVPVANDKRTMLLGAFSGARLLRKTPPDRYIVNYRASYAEETAAMVSGLVRAGVRPYELAFFSQNDAFGDTGYAGAIDALKLVGYADVARLPHGRYKRNTLEVEDALLSILESEIRPRAIIMIGSYAPCAKFIRLARRVLPKTLFLNVSFVDSGALVSILGPLAEGVIITQVVPHFRESHPLCTEYRASLKNHVPAMPPGFVSLEGFIVGKIFIESLIRAGSSPDRERIIDALESIQDLDLGMGSKLRFGKQDHQGSHKVWTTHCKSGEFEPVNWEELKV